MIWSAEQDRLDLEEPGEGLNDVLLELVPCRLDAAHLADRLPRNALGGRLEFQVLLEIDHPSHGIGVHQADDDPEVLLPPDRVGAVDPCLQPDFPEQIFEILHLLPGVAGEGRVGRDNETAGQELVLQFRGQGRPLALHARVNVLGERIDMRLRGLPRKAAHQVAHLGEGPPVHGLGEIDLTVRVEPQDTVEPGQEGPEHHGRTLLCRRLFHICLRRPLEVALGQVVLLLVSKHPIVVAGLGQLLEVLVVPPVTEHGPADAQGAPVRRMRRDAGVDHLQKIPVPAPHHQQHLLLPSGGQRRLLYRHLPPALPQTVGHLAGQRAEELRVHALDGSEDLLDVADPVDLRVAVASIERIDDPGVVVREDLALTQQSHDAREPLNVLLDHQRGHHDSGAPRQLVALPDGFRDLGVVQLGPPADEVLGQQCGALGVALVDLDDLRDRLIGVGAHHHQPRQHQVDSFTVSRRQDCPPSAPRRDRHQLLRPGERTLATVTLAFLVLRPPAQRRLRFLQPDVGHRCQDRRPDGILRVDLTRDQIPQGGQEPGVPGTELALVLMARGVPHLVAGRQHERGGQFLVVRQQSLDDRDQHVGRDLVELPRQAPDLLLSLLGAGRAVQQGSELTAQGLTELRISHSVRLLLGLEVLEDLGANRFVFQLPGLFDGGQEADRYLGERRLHQNPPRHQTPGRVTAADQPGALIQLVPQHPLLLGYDHHLDQHTQLPDPGPGQFAGRRIDEPEHIIHEHRGAFPRGQVLQDLGIDGGSVVFRHLAQHVPDPAPLFRVVVQGELVAEGHPRRIPTGETTQGGPDLARRQCIAAPGQVLVGPGVPVLFRHRRGRDPEEQGQSQPSMPVNR
ncbi:MAG: hypothetical protein ACYTFI_01515 [Planctomycetota bacterium]